MVVKEKRKLDKKEKNERKDFFSEYKEDRLAGKCAKRRLKEGRRGETIKIKWIFYDRKKIIEDESEISKMLFGSKKNYYVPMVVCYNIGTVTI